MPLVSLLAFFVFVVAFGTRILADFNISCETDVHYNCEKEYIRVFDNSNGIHTWTEEDLSVYCREIVKDIDCKQAYLEKCGNDTDSVVYQGLTGGMRDVVEDVCNETSELRAAFRQHNVCIRNVSTKFDLCMQLSFARTREEMDGKENSLTKSEFIIRALCRFQELTEECFTAEVGTACGQNARNFIKTVLSRSRAVHSICAQEDLSPLVRYFGR